MPPSPILLYDEIGLLEWSCSCAAMNGAPQGAAFTASDALSKWERHASGLRSTHSNPTSPHVLVIDRPALKLLFGSLRASCNTCDYEVGSWRAEPNDALTLALAALKQHAP
jgi:hypothetical protein